MNKQATEILKLIENGTINAKQVELPILELFNNLAENPDNSISRKRFYLSWGTPYTEYQYEDFSVKSQPGVTLNSDNYEKNYEDINEAVNDWTICVTEEQLNKLINDPHTPEELNTILKEVSGS